MTRKPSPQEAPSTALAELVKEYPELPDVTWYLTAKSSTLHGHLLDTSFASMHAYAVLMGGSIRASRKTHTGCDGQVRRTHWLTSVWRDVRVELSVALPVPSVEDLLIVQRHELVDPAEPVLPGSCRQVVSA